MNFKLYPYKTAKLKSSYIADFFLLGTHYPLELNNLLPTYGAFSNALKRMSLPQPPGNFNFGPRYPSVLLAQLRLCFSSLNNHLFKIEFLHLLHVHVVIKMKATFTTCFIALFLLTKNISCLAICLTLLTIIVMTMRCLSQPLILYLDTFFMVHWTRLRMLMLECFKLFLNI